MYKFRLDAKKGEIRTSDGQFICSIAITPRAKALLSNADWDMDSETFIQYKKRVAPEVKKEEQKRVELARDMAKAFNEIFSSI